MTKRAIVKYWGLTLLLCTIGLTSCKEKKVKKAEAKEDTLAADLRKALTFYASFDTGVNADFASGDSLLYTVSNRKALDSSRVGLHKPDITRQEGKGKYGYGLQFTQRSEGYIYYASAGNIAYSKENWQGAISFWLSLDPATDLEQGFCDPIQITDVSYNDAAIWVDFTENNPRDFRLGVIGDRNIWNPEGLEDENDLFLPQLVPVVNPPFGKGEWTHILINFSGLNTEKGQASLYINGELKGTRPDISDSFTWELNRSNIYLGLSYIGFMDDLSIYNRALTENEIKALYSTENGVKTILD
ncbi:LamG-like jellyroll fold domain-containing protein [Ulvibacterium marinum]|uniref:LamG domain-containing protein n=1 Tax=Ulvibacterium marinum TaxID=2419782 RepID=A0A3B0C6E5_9FLAO|nr:LamG-like jellyroll fold domain-containing protein [Ulvibacterium marinum]RKN80268.1 LamG domain-containing protein [Ulvibacterium marinum]